MTDESQVDVSVHGFWRWGLSSLFDMKIVNLYPGSYLCQTSVKALEISEKEKKDKYLQTFLERRHTFTPMVYSVDVTPGTEAVTAQQCLALLLSNKLKR